MKKNKNGFALATVLFVSSILILITVNLLYFSSISYSFINRNKGVNKSYSIAESGLKKSISKINKNYSNTFYKFKPIIDINDEIILNTDNNIYSSESYDKTNNYYKYFYNDDNVKYPILYRIEDKEWLDDIKSKSISKKLYNIESMSKFNNIWTSLNTEIEVNRISLFNYGLFFNEDIEIFSKNGLTYTGKIHSNGNIFIDSENELKLNSEITSSKDIIKSRINSSISSGKVFIKDIYEEDKELNTNNDSKSKNWLTESIDIWKGKVQNKQHDITYKNIIDFPSLQRNSFYEKNARYKILLSVNNTLNTETTTIKLIENNIDIFVKTVQKLNNRFSETINLNTFNIPSDTFTETSFLDNNENKNIKVLSIDIFKLQSSIKYIDNLVIYASRDDSIPDSNPSDNIPDNSRLPNGFLLKNGSKLLYPIIFTSNNPVYIQGDFNLHRDINGNSILENTDNYGNTSFDLWRPAIIISDSMNLLSNSWNVNYSNNPTDTEYNFMSVSGFRNNTNSNNFLTNLYRLSESFTNQKIKIRGSFIGIGKTNFSTGSFNSHINPNFDYSYDNSFAKFPFSEQILDLIPSVTESIKILSNKKLINEQSDLYNELKSKKLL